MLKLFLDANIFFAATYSENGGSRMLFECASKNKIKVISSVYAIQEAKRNIELKIGENSLVQFYKLVSILEKVDHTMPNENLSEKYSQLIVEKDLPILISALSMKADFLVTLDKKHFKTEKLAGAQLPLKILLPAEFLQNYL